MDGGDNIYQTEQKKRKNCPHLQGAIHKGGESVEEDKKCIFSFPVTLLCHSLMPAAHFSGIHLSKFAHIFDSTGWNLASILNLIPNFQLFYCVVVSQS